MGNVLSVMQRSHIPILTENIELIFLSCIALAWKKNHISLVREPQC